MTGIVGRTLGASAEGWGGCGFTKEERPPDGGSEEALFTVTINTCAEGGEASEREGRMTATAGDD